MKKYFFKYSCGTGMEHACVIDFPADVTEDELNMVAWELSVDLANSFGGFYYETDLTEEFLEEMEENCEDYFTEDSLDYRWALYDPDKHDMYRCGGGSFMSEFENEEEKET